MSALSKRGVAAAPLFFALILFAAVPLKHVGPAAVLWTAPGILLASLMIAWGAESAQFFLSQGFALAILAWMQTLPEFAVEAVLAWKQQVPLLLANLTGALRLLTGFGWPMIYFAAAVAHRRRTGQPLRRIMLHDQHSVEVVGLFVPLAYVAVICAKGTLDIMDAMVLVVIYATYLAVVGRMPPEDAEGLDDLESMPRAVVAAPPLLRTFLILLLFAGGGALIYYTAEPFLGSLLALSTAIGINQFVFVQWVAPFVSEFPEMASTFYWARTIEKAPMALMNMASSNINQWTLLTAMLPVLFSISRGHASAISFSPQQQLELLMTLAQALVAVLFLINMELAWWEASVLLALFLVQFGASVLPPDAARHVHQVVTITYFVWASVELLRMLTGRRRALAFFRFREMWMRHVLGNG